MSPRPNPPRSLASEGNLAKRIAFERGAREQSYEALAQAMTDAGCPIAGNAIFRVEKADPPRRITVTELVALSRVWDIPVEELLLPMEFLEQRRAGEVAAKMPGAFQAYDDAIVNGLRIYLEYGRLAAGSAELRYYMNEQATTIGWNHTVDIAGVDLGENVTDDEVKELQRDVLDLWGKVLRLAGKAAHVEKEVD